MSTEAADILRDVLLSLRSDGWARYSGGPRLSPPASGLPFEVGSPGGTCLKGAIDRVVMRENRLRGLQLIEAPRQTAGPSCIEPSTVYSPNVLAQQTLCATSTPTLRPPSPMWNRFWRKP